MPRISLNLFAIALSIINFVNHHQNCLRLYYISMNSTKALELLRETERADSNSVAWAVHLQAATQAVWTVAQQPPDGVRLFMIDRFVHVLSSLEALTVASLVIPQLRTLTPEPDDAPSRIQILQRLGQIHPQTIFAPMTHRDIGTGGYQTEQKVVDESSIYYAAIVLYGRSELSDEEMEELLEWWEKRPGPRG